MISEHHPSLAISVVVPVLDEQDNVVELVERLVTVLEANGESFELVFVDDGSRDLTAYRLNELRAHDPRIRLVGLSRSFGQEAAVQAGILRSRGRWIVQLDGDLQHPPEQIPILLAERTHGHEVIYGVRSKRRDPAHRVVLSRVMVLAMKSLLGIALPEDVSTFRVIDGKIARFVAALPEKQKFFSALVEWSGARSRSVPVEHHSRRGGRTKYGLAKLVNHAFDLAVGFSVRPLRVIGAAGALFALGGITFGMVRIAQKLAGADITMGYTSLFSAIVILGGFQLIALSIIGEYVGRIFVQVQDRPIFRVSEDTGVDEARRNASPESERVRSVA